MARLPYVDPERASEPVRNTLAGMPPLGIFRMLAHAETAFDPVLMLGGAILGELELDPRLRELAVLQVARDAECEYEWVQHVAVGRNVGLSEEQIAAVDAGNLEDPALDEVQRAVLRFASEVVLRTRVSDEIFGAVSAELSPREVVELLLTIGDYLMIARLMTTLELDLDDAAAPDAVTSATRARLHAASGGERPEQQLHE
jgi:4-carboxymuconolactone decarboxylase